MAYSLGNFAFSMGGGAPSRTGVLILRLSARGVESTRLRRATPGQRYINVNPAARGGCWLLL
jgi:hypothetical protein